MEFSLISKKSVLWNQPSFPSSEDSNSRLDVNVRVCNLQKLWVPVDFSESLASSKFPIVVTAGDVIDLPSVRIGLETSGSIGPKFERMYMKLSGVARFLEAVFGGNIPKNVIIRVDVPRLKNCLTAYSLTPELSSRKSFSLKVFFFLWCSLWLSHLTCLWFLIICRDLQQLERKWNQVLQQNENDFETECQRYLR